MDTAQLWYGIPCRRRSISCYNWAAHFGNANLSRKFLSLELSALDGALFGLVITNFVYCEWSCMKMLVLGGAKGKYRERIGHGKREMVGHTLVRRPVFW